MQLDYTLYAVKGLAGDNDFDFARSRTYTDNNKTPAFGGRLVLTGDNWAIGGSGSAGTYDSLDQLWYVMAGVEFWLRLGPVVLRGEGLGRRTDLDPNAGGYPFALVDRWFLKAGWYLQADWTPHPKFSVILRTDGLQRWGMPLPNSELTNAAAGVQRQTVAVLVRANEHLAFKADYELWTFTGTSYPLRHLGRVGIVFGY